MHATRFRATTDHHGVAERSCERRRACATRTDDRHTSRGNICAARIDGMIRFVNGSCMSAVRFPRETVARSAAEDGGNDVREVHLLAGPTAEAVRILG
jgi:hypothetical protein